MSSPLLTRIVKIGTSDQFEDEFNNRIKITNSLALMISLGAAAPFIVISYFLYPSLVWMPTVGVIAAASGLLFNYFGLYHLSRYIVSVVPLLLATMYQAYVLDESEDVIIGIYTIQIAFSLLPFLMIRLKEKGLLIFTVLTSFLLIGLLPQLNAYFEVGLDSSLFKDSWLNYMSIYMGLILSVAAVITLVIFSNQSTQRNKRLIEQINIERDKGREAEKVLEENFKTLKESQDGEKNRVWASTGMSDLGDLIRKNQDSKDFYEELINFVVKYLDANQGVIYTIEKNVDNREGDQIGIVPQAAYAFNRKKRLKETYSIGEGLVGQCFVEKDIIFLTDVPENYIRITSGLGDANPRCIIVIPLIQNDAVEGVIELASFNVFAEQQIEFLKSLGETIAGSIFNFRINTRTKRLLEESQEQTEQMRAQEEEMRQNMEEIQATQEENERRSRAYEEEIEALKKQLSA
jgi:hypothetical protein